MVIIPYLGIAENIHDKTPVVYQRFYRKYEYQPAAFLVKLETTWTLVCLLDEMVNKHSILNCAENSS